MLAMLVDEGRSGLLHLRRGLEGSGDADGRPFEDPHVALDRTGRHGFDLVIADPVMPRTDGAETAVVRIPAVADVVDATTTERSNRAAMPVAAALDCIAAERGRPSDPARVGAVLAAHTRRHPPARGAERGAPVEALRPTPDAAGVTPSRVVAFPRAANG